MMGTITTYSEWGALLQCDYANSPDWHKIDRAMKITGKPVPTSVGFFFIGFAVLAAA